MTGKSILITGCSSGIGLCTATILKNRGYRVFAAARKEADVEKLKHQGFESVLLDVNDSASIQHALDHILKLTDGQLDALFNNAGFLQAGAIEDLSRDLIRAQFETNVFGPMELIRLILPIMRKQGHGRIIQNSSFLGVMTLPFYGAYNASKFALEGFSNTLRQELRGTPIYVSIINPGPTPSKLRDNAFPEYQKMLKKSDGAQYQKIYETMEKSYFQPKGHDRKIMQKPDAVAKALIHALESPRPHAHYYVGFISKLLATLRRILPDKSMDWFISRIQIKES